MSDIVSMGEKVQATRLMAIELMPPKIKEAFANFPPEVLELTDIELNEHFNPTPNDFALRKHLWEMVSQSRITGQRIVVDRWIDGIVDAAYLYKTLLFNPYKLCWIFTPYETFQQRYEYGFEILFRKVIKYLTTTDINTDNAKDFIKLLQEFGNRTVGPVVKRVEAKIQEIPAPNMDIDSNLDNRLEELMRKKMASSKTVVDIGES